MPATATRSRENSADTLDSLQPIGPSAPVREDSSDFAAFSRVSTAPPPLDYGVEAEVEAQVIEDENGVEWREVAPLVDRFRSEMPEAERKRRRGLRKRHRNFVMSGVFWVGLLFGIELVGLVYLYSIDLMAVREAATLDKSIQQTTLKIALAQNQLAASSSPAKLDVWAGQLGYHKAQLTEMDDVTSSAPIVVPPPAEPVDAAQ